MWETPDLVGMAEKHCRPEEKATLEQSHTREHEHSEKKSLEYTGLEKKKTSCLL